MLMTLTASPPICANLHALHFLGVNLSIPDFIALRPIPTVKITQMQLASNLYCVQKQLAPNRISYLEGWTDIFHQNNCAKQLQHECGSGLLKIVAIGCGTKTATI
jgi:hypothetical protein